MPDRLPSLVLLVGFWIPPAVVGWTAAKIAYQRTRQARPTLMYAALTLFALAWSLAWFLFQRNRIPPYLPGATHDPTFAPPEAIAGLAVVTAVLVLPGSALACMVAFRRFRATNDDDLLVTMLQERRSWRD